jgi:hypothetical protein
MKIQGIPVYIWKVFFYLVTFESIYEEDIFHGHSMPGYWTFGT